MKDQVEDNATFNRTFEEWMSLYDDWKKDWEALNEKHWQTIIITLYALVIVFGFFANLLIVVVIIRYKQLHTVTNIFICYLALADVGMCVFNLPLQLHYQISNKWVFGRVLCYFTMPTFGVTLFSSSLSILMIAVDRYMLIVYPFKRRLSNKQAILSICIILMLALLVSTPLFVYVKHKFIPQPELNSSKIFCMELWPSYSPKQIYTVINFLIQFVIPISLTSLFYFHICLVLQRRPIKKHDTRRNQRTNRILIAVVLTFTICWLPWNLFSLVSEFSHKLVVSRYFNVIDLLLKLFAMGSACINPFLYGWLNGNFKKELGKIFGYRFCWKEVQRNGVSYSRTTDINGTFIQTNVCLSEKPSEIPTQRTQMMDV